MNEIIDKQNNNEECAFKGSLVAVLRKADGTVIVTRKDNLILNGGFDFIAEAIGNATSRPNAMGYIAVGTGSTAVAASQTALTSELARKAAIYSFTKGTKVFTFSATFGQNEAVGAITEAGVCNAASDGTFLDRVTFAVINKAADDTVTMTFQFTLS